MGTVEFAMPAIKVAAGFTTNDPTGGSGLLILGDATDGKLGSGKLGTSITWSDITDYVQSFSISRTSTRTQGPLWNYEAGTFSAVLDNSDGRFDPDNTNGPYVVNGETRVTPMVPIRVTANYGPNVYHLFTGFADAWQPADLNYSSETGEALITLSATDAFKILAGINLAQLGTATGAGDLSGTRIKYLLEQAEWYTDAEWFSIDTGDHTVQGTTLGSDALSLLRLTADSEGGQLYVAGTGAVTFRDRSATADDSRSNSVQAVFGDSPGTVHSAGTELPLAKVSRAVDDTTIANDIQATRVGGTMQEVTDTASISKYLFKRTYSRSDLILETDSDALTWASWVLSISSDGFNRIESIEIDPRADQAGLWPQAFGREIGDRIQVWLRPPNVVNHSAWNLTNNYGAAPENQFTIPTSDVQLLTVGDRFEIHNSDGTLKENKTFRITDLGADFFGNTAITFKPSASEVLAVGDIVKQTGGHVYKDCFITGITHTWDGLRWNTGWTLEDASRYVVTFFTLGDDTFGQLGHNILS